MPRKKKTESAVVETENIIPQAEPETVVPAPVPTEKKTTTAVEKDVWGMGATTFADDELQLSKYLKVKDFVASVTAKNRGIINRLPLSLVEDAKKIAAIYDKIYDHFNGNVVLNSGYRCTTLNNAVGGSPTSQHVKGQAIDVAGKNGVKNVDILKWIQNNLQYNQLIWEFGTPLEPKWVHVGYGTRMQFLRIGVKNTKGLAVHLSGEGDI